MNNDHQEILLKLINGYYSLPDEYQQPQSYKSWSLYFQNKKSWSNCYIMATYNPAVYFNITDQYGSVAKGKVADLVILDKNPVENIQNTLQVSTVMRDGEPITLSHN